MKIALLLSTICAALIFNGCSTNRGGTADEYSTSSGSAEETSPPVTDPSLPANPNVGPQITPP